MRLKKPCLRSCHLPGKPLLLMKGGEQLLLLTALSNHPQSYQIPKPLPKSCHYGWSLIRILPLSPLYPSKADSVLIASLHWPLFLEFPSQNSQGNFLLVFHPMSPPSHAASLPPSPLREARFWKKSLPFPVFGLTLQNPVDF